MPIKDDAAKSIKDYLDALENEGVGPKAFAAFAKNMGGFDDDDLNEDVNKDNLPGYSYLSRISEAGFNALTAHGETANAAWKEIRRGRYGFGRAMRDMSKLVENYYGVLCEASRGIEEQRRPVWLLVPYSRKKPTNRHSVRIETTLAPGQLLEHTKFEAFGGGAGYDTLFAADGEPKVEGARLTVRFDEKKIAPNANHVPDGYYVCFVYPQGAGSGPPVAIIVIHVTP
jgi:hypothetical protein